MSVGRQGAYVPTSVYMLPAIPPLSGTPSTPTRGSHNLKKVVTGKLALTEFAARLHRDEKVTAAIVHEKLRLAKMKHPNPSNSVFNAISTVSLQLYSGRGGQLTVAK